MIRTNVEQSIEKSAASPASGTGRRHSVSVTVLLLAAGYAASGCTSARSAPETTSAAPAALAATPAAACTTVTPCATTTISIDTTRTTPVPRGFSGFNYTIRAIGNEADFAAAVKSVSPGWIRYPAGTGSQAFDWSTGESPDAMVAVWAGLYDAHADKLETAQRTLAGMDGGDMVGPFSAFATGAGAAGLVVSVNGFTDTDTSAGDFAHYAKENSIEVLAWELSNEPYLYPLFYPSDAGLSDGTVYATQMKPFYDAIHKKDASAVVSLFESPSDSQWLAGYGEPYWDAISLHDYNQTAATDIQGRMTFYDEYLAHGLVPYYLPYVELGKPIVVSEFAPGGPDGDPLDGCLYYGVYAAEYILRLSTPMPTPAAEPGVRYVGLDTLDGADGIDPDDAGATAEIEAVGVANLGVRQAGQAYATTVEGSPDVTFPPSPALLPAVPAIYAQAYEGNDQNGHLVITNKGSAAVPISIQADGSPFQASGVAVTQVSPPGSDAGPSTTIASVESTTIAGRFPASFTVPPYSVVHLQWPIAVSALP